nr:odorant-binding protein 10 [Lytta caraganae]
MKFIVLFVTIVALITISNAEIEGASDETKEYFGNIRKTCMEKTDVDEATIDKANEGDFDDGNDKFKCYAYCVMRELKTMDENGGIHYEPMMEYLPEDYKEPVKEMFEACDNFTDDDLCMRAYNVFKCNAEKYPEYFFVV